MQVRIKHDGNLFEFMVDGEYVNNLGHRRCDMCNHRVEQIYNTIMNRLSKFTDFPKLCCECWKLIETHDVIEVYKRAPREIEVSEFTFEHFNPYPLIYFYKRIDGVWEKREDSPI